MAAAVIRRNGAYLVALRPPGKRHGGRWEFPGGKLRSGESAPEGLRRELREELEVELLDTGRTLASIRDPGTPFLIRFIEARAEGEPRAVEHDEVRWAKPAELASLPLAPSDARFVTHILSET